VLSPRTERDYRQVVERWTRDGQPDPATWVSERSSDATRRNARAGLIWHFRVNLGRTLDIPRVPPKHMPVPRAFSIEELSLVREAALDAQTVGVGDEAASIGASAVGGLGPSLSKPSLPPIASSLSSNWSSAPRPSRLKRSHCIRLVASLPIPSERNRTEGGGEGWLLRPGPRAPRFSPLRGCAIASTAIARRCISWWAIETSSSWLTHQDSGEPGNSFVTYAVTPRH
jgi:hypothetical protein